MAFKLGFKAQVADVRQQMWTIRESKMLEGFQIGVLRHKSQTCAN